MPFVDGSALATESDDAFQSVAVWLHRHQPRRAPHIACGVGDCGVCTVLIDGDPALACITPMGTVLDGATIQTPAYLAAHTDAGAAIAGALEQTCALQCGFCAPWIIAVGCWAVGAAAGSAAREVPIQALLANHICRCTGYAQIIEALEAAMEAVPAAGAQL